MIYTKSDLSLTKYLQFLIVWIYNFNQNKNLKNDSFL